MNELARCANVFDSTLRNLENFQISMTFISKLNTLFLPNTFIIGTVSNKCPN